MPTCPDENVVAALAEGRLDPRVRLELDAHFDACARCTLLLRELGALILGDREAPPPAPPRYRLLSKLGGGGMGVVWAAIDRELNRSVALKLVRTDAPGDSRERRARLLREAELLASIVHPNVVTVYDVGQLGDELYIAMEHIVGRSIRQWLDEAPRAWREVVDVYLLAGRGLGAAHAAGLVHRDVKPDNLLVADDGRVIVVDFGLAVAAARGDATGPGLTAEARALRASPSPARLTATGAVLGTPAYMAPEQRAGEAIDVRTDVYAFCVSLHEGLHGARPSSPARRSVPAALDRALARGIADDPDARWPAMAPLLDRLAAIRDRRRRRWAYAIAASVIAAAIAGGVVVAGAARGRDDTCGGVAAAIDRVWTPARRDGVRAAIARVRGGDGAAIADGIVHRFDERARAWETMRVDVCEASDVRRTEDVAVATRRITCLDRNLEAMDAAIALLTDATPARAANSVAIARSGGEPADCTAAATLGQPAVPRTSPALARRAAELGARFDADDAPFVTATGPALARELEAAGDLDDAARVWYEVASTGADLPTDALRDAARTAARLATETGDDVIANRAWATAAEIAADADLANVDDLLAMSAAAAARTHAPSAAMLTELARGTVLERRGDYDLAIATCQRVYDDARARYGEVSELPTRALACLGTIYAQQQRWDDAARVVALEAASERTLYGPDASTTLDADKWIGLIAINRGERAAGRAQVADVIARKGRAYGEDSIEVMKAWYDLALAEGGSAEQPTPEALVAARRAGAIAERALPPDDPRAARVWWQLADLLDNSGDHAAAAEAYMRVLAIFDGSHDPRSWSRVAFNAAEAFRATGRCDRVVAMLDRVARLADAGQTDRVVGAAARGTMGACEVVLGRRADGLAALDAAIADLDALGAADLAAQLRLEAAEIYWTAGDRDRARALAQQVIDRIPADDDAHRSLRAQADDDYLHPKPGARGPKK
jgi:tRNA A-37 threonylcarbamoyl transferase component Bud32/tetratricopeptide (TPR) repeat protein